MQDSYLILAITDTEFLKLTIGQIAPDIFTSSVVRNLSRIVFDYYSRFKRSPAEHFHDEVLSYLEDFSDEDKEDYVRYLKKLDTIKPNADYVLKRLDNYIKQREYENGAIEFAELVSEKQFDKAQNLMYKALKSGIQKEDVGLRYLTDLSSLAHRGESIEYLMPTGIKALDNLIGGYQRMQLVVWCGGYKGGKTWALLHIAREALYTGLKVLFVSHEVTQDEVELRLDMMFTGRASEHIGEYIEYPYYEKNQGINSRKVKTKSVFNSKAVRKARKAMKRFGGEIVVKKYPMGQCTTQELERYLNYLETFESFVPDVLINDYADIMNHDNHNDMLRHQLNQTYIWHKGLADERNILVVTASQIATEFLLKKRITQAAPAEDKRKVGNADIMLGITRTHEEIERNLGHISVMAIRSGGQQFAMCAFVSCLQLGQFCIDSWIGKDLDDQAMNYFADIDSDD